MIAGVVVPIVVWRLAPADEAVPRRLLLDDVSIAPGLHSTEVHELRAGRTFEIFVEGTIRCRSFRRRADHAADAKEPSPSVRIQVSAFDPAGRPLAEETMNLGIGQCSDYPFWVGGSVSELDLSCRTMLRWDALAGAGPSSVVLTLPPDERGRDFLVEGELRVSEVSALSAADEARYFAYLSCCLFPLGVPLLLIGLVVGRRRDEAGAG